MSGSRGTSQERETPFAGYGDRVGSGVALAPARWKGGEVVNDPALVNKSLKTRRMFYSPIGDGVVAADGVELKRIPQDLTPRVEVIQQRVVERGDPGKAGVKVTEKKWTTGGGGGDSANAYGSEYAGAGGPGDGRSSAGGFSTPNTAGFSPNAGISPNARISPNAGVPSALARPASIPERDFVKELSDLVGSAPKQPLAAATKQEPGSKQKEYRSESADNYSTGSTLPDRTKSPMNGFPASGRTSTTSAGLYEPGYRYEIKKDYQITNPKELIHQYATTTPVTTIDPTIETTTRTITKQHFTQTIDEFGPFPPYTAGNAVPSPLKFTRELRDQTLTDSQRRANQNMQPMNDKDAQYGHRIEEIRRSTSRSGYGPDEVDQLATRLASGLHTPQYK